MHDSAIVLFKRSEVCNKKNGLPEILKEKIFLKKVFSDGYLTETSCLHNENLA